MNENEFIFVSSVDEEPSGHPLVYLVKKAEWDDPAIKVIALYLAQEKDGEMVPMEHLLHQPVSYPSSDSGENFVFQYFKWYKVIGPRFIFSCHKQKNVLQEYPANSN